MTRVWFERNWMYAGLIASLFLLALAPLLAGAWSAPRLLVYLLLPIYMLHQVEEHTDDRFRRSVNELMAGGRDALTTPAVVVINVGGVWMVYLLTLYLARFVTIGFGLIAAYIMIVNALVHVVGGVVQRRYNPGLVTAVVLFLPFGISTLVVVGRAPGVTLAYHAVGLVLALLLHVAIIVHVRRRAAALGRS